MLLDPKLKQEFRDPLPYRKEAMDPGVAGRAYRNQERRAVVARLTVVDAKPLFGAAGAAAPAIPLQDLIAQTPEETERMAPLGVAGAAESSDKGWKGTARAKERKLLQIPFPAAPRSICCFECCPRVRGLRHNLDGLGDLRAHGGYYKR